MMIVFHDCYGNNIYQVSKKEPENIIAKNIYTEKSGLPIATILVIAKSNFEKKVFEDHVFFSLYRNQLHISLKKKNSSQERGLLLSYTNRYNELQEIYFSHFIVTLNREGKISKVTPSKTPDFINRISLQQPESKSQEPQ